MTAERFQHMIQSVEELFHSDGITMSLNTVSTESDVLFAREDLKNCALCVPTVVLRYDVRRNILTLLSPHLPTDTQKSVLIPRLQNAIAVEGLQIAFEEM